MSSNISGATMGKQKYEKSFEKIYSKSRELKPHLEYQVPVDSSMDTHSRPDLKKKKSSQNNSSRSRQNKIET
jgi:hypothetical protein